MNKKYLTILIFVMFFVVVSASDMYISSLPKVAAAFGVDTFVANLTISVYTFGAAIFGLFTGLFSERYGRRKVILTGMIIFSLSSLGVFISSSIWVIIGFRLLQSCGSSAIMIVARLIIKDTMNKQEQINATGTALLAMAISPAISPVIGALLASYFSWKVCFLVTAILGIILFYETQRVLKETHTNTLSKLPSIVEYLKTYMQLFIHPILFCVIMIVSACFGAYFSFISISSFIFIKKLGFTPVTFSWIFIFIAASFFVGNSFMRAMNKRNKKIIQIIYWGIILSSIGTIILWFTYVTSNNILIGLILLLGALITRGAIAIINPPLQILAMNYFHDKSGQALGIVSSTQFIGASIGIATVSSFHDSPILGLQVTSSIFIGIACIFFYILKRKLFKSNF